MDSILGIVFFFIFIHFFDIYSFFYIYLFLVLSILWCLSIFYIYLFFWYLFIFFDIHFHDIIHSLIFIYFLHLSSFWYLSIFHIYTFFIHPFERSKSGISKSISSCIFKLIIENCPWIIVQVRKLSRKPWSLSYCRQNCRQICPYLGRFKNKQAMAEWRKILKKRWHIKTNRGIQEYDKKSKVFG